MQLRTIQNKIIIKPDTEPDHAGLIFIPTAYRHTVWTGLVVAIGDDVKDIVVGMRVVIDTARAVQVTYNSEEYMFTRSPEILGICKEDDVMIGPVGTVPMTRREWEGTIKDQGGL